jgi:hypothetical protein
MRTRIKVVERRNGSKVYRPEYREYWWGDWTGIGNMKASDYSFLSNIELAQQHIDSFLEQREENRLEEIKNRQFETVKTTYVKYP